VEKHNKLCTNDVLNVLYKNYLEKKKEYRNDGIIIKMKKNIRNKYSKNCIRNIRNLHVLNKYIVSFK